MLSRINQPDCILVNDGIGMDIAAVLTHGSAFSENLNGTDFTPHLFRSATRPLKVFMVGGKPEVLTRAIDYVREKLRQDVVGSCDGYAGLRSNPNLAAQINQTKAEVVLVALGNPMQEKWIFSQIDQIDSSLIMGVGALFDFWSGDKVRAPLLIQKLKLEWLFRLAQEPRRLTKRYTIDIGVFLYHCFKYR
jgi:beta-1,4-glucosyltransferase